MAEVGTWRSIQDRGLLSTSALLDLFETQGEERFSIESEHRPNSVPIEHPIYGRAIIRDQKPMRESALNNCLIDMTAREWFELLNGKVFFWPTRERLMRLLAARAYRNKPHCVLTIRTERLIAAKLENIKLSPINSGSTLYNPQPRGSRTFLPLDKYPYEERKRLRGIPNAIAELCVEYSVEDVGALVTRVCHMHGPNETEVLYQEH